MISVKLRPVLPNKDDHARASRLNSSLVSLSSLLLTPPRLEQNNAKLPYSGPSRSDPARQHKHTEPLASAWYRSSFLQATWTHSLHAERCLSVHVGSRRQVNSRSQTGNSGRRANCGEKRGIEFGATDEHAVFGKAKQFTFGFGWAGLLL